MSETNLYDVLAGFSPASVVTAAGDAFEDLGDAFASATGGGYAAVIDSVGDAVEGVTDDVVGEVGQTTREGMSLGKWVAGAATAAAASQVAIVLGVAGVLGADVALGGPLSTKVAPKLGKVTSLVF